MRNKKIFITGGTGFIGSNLVRKLVEERADVYLAIRHVANLWRIKDIVKKTSVLKVDLLDKERLQKKIKTINPDIVYHFAAYGAYSHQADARKIMETNIIGTLNLASSLVNSNISLFVNTGSSSEYGFKIKPMKESDVLNPNSYYSISKAAQTHIFDYYYTAFGFPGVTLRPFSVYGPYEEPGRLIPNLMLSILKNKPLSMTSKAIARDFIHVDDYVNACLTTAELKKYPGQIFNIGSGRQTNFGQLIEIAEKAVDKKIDVKWNKNSGKSWDTDHWKSNIHKAKKLLGFQPRYKLKEGLYKTYKWFKEHENLYEHN